MHGEMIGSTSLQLIMINPVALTAWYLVDLFSRVLRYQVQEHKNTLPTLTSAVAELYGQ